MGLAKKLLNSSIKFDGKIRNRIPEVQNVVACEINGKIVVEFTTRERRNDITQYHEEYSPNEFISFLREATSLKLITYFGNGRTLKYNRSEIIAEIAERKANFFTNGDAQSWESQIDNLPIDFGERPRPARKTIRDEIEQNKSSQDDSKRSLVVRTGNDTRKESTEIRFL